MLLQIKNSPLLWGQWLKYVLGLKNIEEKWNKVKQIKRIMLGRTKTSNIFANIIDCIMESLIYSYQFIPKFRSEGVNQLQITCEWNNPHSLYGYSFLVFLYIHTNFFMLLRSIVWILNWCKYRQTFEIPLVVINKIVPWDFFCNRVIIQ